MPLTLLDLEKVNHMMNQQQNVQVPHQGSISNNFGDFSGQNMNNLLNNQNAQNAAVLTKNNLFANVLLQQFQTQQNTLNNKLFNNNLILNCIQANAAAAQLLQSQNSDNQKQINYSRYKTELCRQFIENGECKYGDKCQFAHGMPDLKDVNRHPKYKTDYCKTFHSKGFCPYGPRCHFIHELHEKFDPSIQNVSTGKKVAKTGTTGSENTAKPNVEDTQLIDKQFEAIQAQLASTLFVSEDSNDNFTVNDSKHQLTENIELTLTEKHNNVQSESNSNSNSSFHSSGPSSPVTSSCHSASSYNSSSNSASVSSSTSPVNRVSKKTVDLQENNFYNKGVSGATQSSNSFFDNAIKNIFDGVAVDEHRSASQLSRSASPSTSRARSSTSSTSSACSSSSSSSFEFNLCDENQLNLKDTTVFLYRKHNNGNKTYTEVVTSPIKQKMQPIQRSTFPPKNLGPIGRPQTTSNIISKQNQFDMERVNNLLLKQNITNTNINGNKSNLKSVNFNKDVFTDSTNNTNNQQNGSFFPVNNDFNAYNQYNRQSSW